VRAQLAAGNEFREIVEFLFPFSEMGDQTVDSLVSHHAEVRRKELAECVSAPDLLCVTQWCFRAVVLTAYGAHHQAHRVTAGSHDLG